MKTWKWLIGAMVLWLPATQPQAEGPVRGLSPAARQLVATVRKSACTGPDLTGCSSITLAAAFCEPDELLISGGCLMPGENGENPGPDMARVFPRAMIGLYSAPVRRASGQPMTLGTEDASTSVDLILGSDGAAEMPLGAGWMCQVQSTTFGQGQVIYPQGGTLGANSLQGGWYYRTRAYAVCLR